MKELTQREKDILEYIEIFYEDFGYAPSYRDIADGLYLSSTYSIQCHVQHLIDKGYLEVTPKTARSIRLKTKTG